jgi:hypothetical protein
VFENRVLRGIFGPKRGEVTGEWRKLHNKNFIICTHPQILLGRSNQGKLGGQGIWHAWERGENCTSFWWEIPKEGDHTEDQGVDGRVGIRKDLREIEWGGVDWIRLAQDRDRRAVMSAVMNLRVLAPRI